MYQLDYVITLGATRLTDRMRDSPETSGTLQKHPYVCSLSVAQADLLIRLVEDLAHLSFRLAPHLGIWVEV